MRFSTFIAAAALISASAATLAVAQTPPAASLPLPAGVSMKPADAPAGAYTLDGRHASVTWRIRHQGVSLFTARFDKIEGKLNFDTADPAKSTVEAVVQTGSVSTNVFNAQGEPAFAKEIANQFLGGEANPPITFKSTGLKTTGAATGLLSGDLTLKGVTKPVVFEVEFLGSRLPPMGNNPRYRIGFQGRTIIDRTAFGVSAANIDATTAKEVEIIINAEFVKDA